MTTSFFIFTPSNLHQAAWLALLENQPGITIAGTFGDLKEISPLSLKQSTAILVDIPAIQVDFVSQLNAALPDHGLLILVDHYELDKIVSFLRAGATGLLSRDAAVSDLARAIIATGRGEIVLPPELTARALVALARGEGETKEEDIALTGREQDVLSLLAKGLTNKDIAQSLFLSVRTIETHLRNIYDKLNVTSRTEAALWAVNHGYGDQIASGTR